MDYFKHTIWAERIDAQGREYEEESEVNIAAKYQVCPRCEGKGRHATPDLDRLEGAGADWDEESRDEYLGDDMNCLTCGGLRVVLVALEPDDDSLSADQRGLQKEYHNSLSVQDHFEDEDERARYGHGGWA